MNTPEKLYLHFDAQLTELYRKEGPKLAGAYVDNPDHINPSAVSILRITLRTSPNMYPDRETEPANTPVNFEITRPVPINALALVQFKTIANMLGGVEESTVSDPATELFSDGDSIFYIRAGKIDDQTTDPTSHPYVTPSSALIPLAGTAIRIRAWDERYICNIPSDQTELAALIMSGLLIFNKET